MTIYTPDMQELRQAYVLRNAAMDNGEEPQFGKYRTEFQRGIEMYVLSLIARTRVRLADYDPDGFETTEEAEIALEGAHFGLDTLAAVARGEL